jgi:hypothetical protein
LKHLALALALVVFPAAAQDKAPPKKKQIAHKKATPEQIRKFKELEKKQKKD